MMKVLKILAGPLIGTRGSMALGRVAFLIAFGIAVYFWTCRPPEAFPSTLFESLAALLVYNFSSKLGRKSEPKAEPKVEPDPEAEA
jgi:hypothetical protein